MNLSATNHHLDISATKGNVPISELEAIDPPSVLEPSSYALLLAGMLAGVSVAKRVAAQKA
jgi:hypothetical protein